MLWLVLKNTKLNKNMFKYYITYLIVIINNTNAINKSVDFYYGEIKY